MCLSVWYTHTHITRTHTHAHSLTHTHTHTLLFRRKRRARAHANSSPEKRNGEDSAAECSFGFAPGKAGHSAGHRCDACVWVWVWVYVGVGVGVCSRVCGCVCVCSPACVRAYHSVYAHRMCARTHTNTRVCACTCAPERVCVCLCVSLCLCVSVWGQAVSPSQHLRKIWRKCCRILNKGYVCLVLVCSCARVLCGAGPGLVALCLWCFVRVRTLCTWVGFRVPRARGCRPFVCPRAGVAVCLTRALSLSRARALSLSDSLVSPARPHPHSLSRTLCLTRAMSHASHPRSFPHRTRAQKKMGSYRPGGRPSVAQAQMLQGLKLRDMAQQQGTTVEKIKVSGPAPQTVILLVSRGVHSCVACIGYLVATICHLPSALCHQPSPVYHLPSAICPLPPAFLGHLRAACCALFLHICMYLRCASVCTSGRMPRLSARPHVMARSGFRV